MFKYIELVIRQLNGFLYILYKIQYVYEHDLYHNNSPF